MWKVVVSVVKWAAQLVHHAVVVTVCLLAASRVVLMADNWVELMVDSLVV